MPEHRVAKHCLAVPQVGRELAILTRLTYSDPMVVMRWFWMRKRYGRWARRLGLTALGVFAHMPNYAAEGDQPGSTGAAQDSQEPATAERETGTAGSDGGEERSSEVFLPTEEISEDYAAPFPVDI